ncbi:Transcription termination factor 2 [Dissostichus eleginoides]|uniref:Transcription termination factor 2 n=1 Tax=Dissostichus eleginoides TaxID=100907 RepID=A0AAD9CL66_DISEL|nr:Transcription termination factor 2 [Dissostichus eleginoides]
MCFLTDAIGSYEHFNFHVQATETEVNESGPLYIQSMVRTMEKILCNVHGSICMLKTGVKDGPSKGKSYFVCVDKPGCDFCHVASISPSHCLQHEDSMVELQALTYSQQQQSHRLFYRCIDGKKAGQKWCGNVPWTAPEKDKRNPRSYTQLQPSCLPPVLNPFKAGGKTDKDSEWRRMHRGGDEEKRREEKDSKPSHKAEEKESFQKENVEVAGEKVNQEDSYRGKPLPPGMKVKKRVSDEERNSSEANGLENNTDKVQDKTKERHPKQGETEETVSTSNVKGAHPQKVHTTLQDPLKESSQHPNKVQKTLTTFAGFQPKVKGQQEDPKGLHSLLTAQLQQKKATLSVVNLAALPDKGERLWTQVKELEDALESMSLAAASQPEAEAGHKSADACPISSQVNPFARQGGTILLPAPPAPGLSQHGASGSSLGLQLSQGHPQMHGGSGKKCDLRGHRPSPQILESCPDPEAEVPDPKGIKVTLLAHQRSALAWLLWRETQNPSDDMGLGKTLTIIALILAKKSKAKGEVEKKEEKQAEGWISKTDSSLVVSKGTLIICPASLVHHWKMEIDRRLKAGMLSVCLYHGPNRERSAKVLAGYDVVVTTYSLVSKEAPVQKEDAEKPSKDTDHVPSNSGPLLRVTWARVVLDEGHSIKNPKVQTSMAVCQLRARARWAVTGTPIQNNLLDMYSLLKFLRCSPFDEFKLWKAQVDNGSNRGRERLNILTRTLLLRRTKTQLDSSGKPLVSLPDRTCEVHQLKLSKDEQAVYDVVFAQSKSTLQNYLKRHEGTDATKGKASSSNPFDKVAQEFGMSQSDPAASSSQQPQQASSTVHILSLLLRLRQCCFLVRTLDTSELQGDGIVLSLEEQLNALCLSSSPSPTDPQHTDTVALNGTRFPSKLFEDTSESTKIAAIVSELHAIREKGDNQKSVIVSQWTSMLKIVAVHLQQMGLRYAVIDGTVNPKRRMDLVEEFNTNPDGPQVMLVSLCAGGVGLNLIGGNHLFLIDMHWNPALEDQACDRIYRVGQVKDVTIHRFVCDGTVEDKIAVLQGKKKELAQNVLSGKGSTATKLSLADIRIIFGV